MTHITNGVDGTMTQTLGYDELDRLTSAASTADNESYTYDANGNRLTGLINGNHWTYTPDASSNQLASAANDTWYGSYNYDAQGNMLGTGTGHQYWTYDSFGRMRTATPLSGSPVTTYDVNPQGQRLRKYTSSDSAYFAPDVSGALLAESDNGTWYDYVWLNGRLIGLTVSGSVFSLHDDQTGRPQVMTTPNTPSIAWAAQNKAFDRTVTTDAYGNFNLGFPGQYYDSEIGDYWYNGHRDYDATFGRYLESDPIGLAGGVNTYAYVGDNPITEIDPLGLCPTCTQLQQAAAKLAGMLNDISTDSGALAAAGLIGTALSGIGEVPTLGADTPVTITLGAATATFGDISVVTGGAAAALDSFAGGNSRSLENFDFNRIEEIAITAEISKLPGVGQFGEGLGAISGQAMDLASEGQEACQQQ